MSSRKGRQIISKFAQCSEGTQLHMMRSAMRCGAHLVVQNGVTDAAVVETRLTAEDGSTFDADVVFFDPSSRARVILEVSIVTIGSDTSLGRGARAGLDGVNAQLRARERTSAIIASSRGCLTRREITLFSPPSLCQPVELWARRWWLS